MADWYAVLCRPLKEKQAAAVLRTSFGVPVYFPEIQRTLAQTQEYTPLFPCYLFVQVDLQHVPPHCIKRAPGVVQLVNFDGVPQSVPATVIEELHEQIALMNSRGGVCDHRFQPGDPVRLKRGPMRGLEGIFQGPTEPSERVRILIDFMGSLNRLEVDVDVLEPGPTPQHPPKRRTRGKGRRIKTHIDQSRTT